MIDLKKRVEAVLFSSGKYIPVEGIARLCRSDVSNVTNVLNDLKKDYDAKESSLILINEGNTWKLTVREKYLSLVRKIVSEAELTKAVMQTLAYIAYKAPILQSDVVSVRSNKAYDHIAELESKGFVTKTKHGRTFLIKLTQKFMEYFDLKGEEEIKKRFGGVEELSPEEVLLRDVEKKWEKAKEEKVETEVEGSEEKSQIDELKEKQKQEATQKETNKVEQHFDNLKKEEGKKDKTNIVSNKNKK